MNTKADKTATGYFAARLAAFAGDDGGAGGFF